MLNELYDEAVDVADVEGEGKIEDELGARRVLIVVQQIEREKAQVEARKRAVVSSYDAEISRLEERAKFLRAGLHSYVIDHGKAKFPDVGTAYTTPTATKVVVTDRDAVQAKFGELFTKTSFDETTFREYAAKLYEEKGEILEGCDVVPASTTLAIRKA